MLDIKTKDYEAREELLEHRRKMSLGLQLMYVFIWSLFLAGSAYFLMQIQNIDLTITKLSSYLYLIAIGTIAFPMSATMTMYFMLRQKNEEDEERYYKLLIYLKKNYKEDKIDGESKSEKPGKP